MKKTAIIAEALNNLDFADLVNIFNDMNDGFDDDVNHIYNMSEFDKAHVRYSAHEVAEMTLNVYFDDDDDFFFVDDSCGYIVSLSSILSPVCPIHVEDLAEFVYAHDDDYGIPALREALDAEGQAMINKVEAVSSIIRSLGIHDFVELYNEADAAFRFCHRICWEDNDDLLFYDMTVEEITKAVMGGVFSPDPQYFFIDKERRLVSFGYEDREWIDRLPVSPEDIARALIEADDAFGNDDIRAILDGKEVEA